MILEKLHPVGAGRFARPAALKLAIAAGTLAVFAASGAQAQFDSGGYTSASTPQARAQQTQQAKERAVREGLIKPGTLSAAIPELQIFAAVSLAETYTSNGSGTTNNERYDLYTQPGIHLGALEQSRRLTASLDYSLTGQYHIRNHDLDQLNHRLSAMANAELIEQTLFLDAQASARPTALTRTGSLTADDGTPTNNNYRNTYSYAARPTLIHQFGNAVETDLWFSQSGVFFVRPSSANTTPLPGFFQPPTNSNTSAVGARIASLGDFVRFRWSLNASASDTYQTAHNSQKVRSATANASYALTNSLSIIGTGGYQSFHTTYLLRKDLDGPTLLGGFQYAPNPNFNMYVQAGTQNNFPTYIGSLTWNVTPLTSIAAHANDRIETPQQQLMNNLQNSGGDLGGGMGTPGSSPTIPLPGTGGADGGFTGDSLSIDNSIYRYRQYEAIVTHNEERTSYSLSVFGTLRDRLNIVPFGGINLHDKHYGIRAQATHKLRRDLSGSLGFSASKANEFNGNDRILEGRAGLNYNASETLDFYLDTSLVNRHSRNLIGFDNGNLTDVRVTIGVHKSF